MIDRPMSHWFKDRFRFQAHPELLDGYSVDSNVSHRRTRVFSNFAGSEDS